MVKLLHYAGWFGWVALIGTIVLLYLLSPKHAGKYRPSKYSNIRMVQVSNQFKGNGDELRIYQDQRTGREFLLIKNSRGLALCQIK